MEQTKRLYSFDLLRILAAFSVVVLHATAQRWYVLPLEGSDWFFTNAINVLSRFGVPIFVMLSGALFLAPEKDIPLKQLWTHYILRLAILYAVWSFVYCTIGFISAYPGSFSTKFYLKCILSGHYHLWFLPLMIGIYAIVPILRKWVLSGTKKDVEYFLLLFVLFEILITTVKVFIKTPEVQNFLNNFNFPLICSYVGYFVLGHYLMQYGLAKKVDTLLSILFPICIVVNIVVSTLQSRSEGVPLSDFSNSFGLFTFLLTIAIFRFFTKNENAKSAFFEKHQTLGRFVLSLSKSTLGIYLLHLAFLESTLVSSVFDHMNAVLAALIALLCAFILSAVVATILRKIPFVGRYIC